ncbi:MAG: helix-hairpin-helix domain-containing protein, partial [Acetatifactor sp.]|nr:helix-hairpin-helix domain-containing protein [Acetatifactor sp.]
TASRESEQVIVELLKELDRPVQYVIVNEAGASVYSASKLATEEFPNFDVGQRSAASIARRLQDPLAELVKIDPKSIGVGQYQHDMNQKKLSDALNGVVEDSVNKVGVDLNTASASLLEYVSGINKTIAKNIVDYRENNGRFVSRKQLLKVPKLGPKAYEQCAGFLRILDGKNPLDATSVHPESYEAAKQLMEKLGLTMEDIKEAQKQAAAKKASGRSSAAQSDGQKNGNGTVNAAKKREEQKGKAVRVHNTNTAMGKALAAAMGGMTFDNSQEVSAKQTAPAAKNAVNDAKDMSGLEKRIKNKKLLAEELGIGEITLTDILKELEKPGRDPRDDMPKPILRSDVLDMKDLKPGMILKGTVRNVIDFGVFVDIGVHQDGLVHISQITDRYIKHPLEAVSVGDIVDVQVLTVDVAKKRIGLTMKIQKQ